LGELLLSVHRSYLPLLKDYLTDPNLKGLAHITGGGIIGNLKWILPAGISAQIKLRKTEIPPFFHWLQEAGKLSEETMRETFNLGTGMICIIDNEAFDKYLTIPEARCIGELVNQNPTKEKVEFIQEC